MICNENQAVHYSDNVFDEYIKHLLTFESKNRISSWNILELLKGCQDNWYKTQEAILINSPFYYQNFDLENFESEDINKFQNLINCKRIKFLKNKRF